MRSKLAVVLALIVAIELFIFLNRPVPIITSDSDIIPSQEWMIKTLDHWRAEGKHFIDYEAQKNQNFTFGIILGATILVGGILVFTFPNKQDRSS